MNRLSPQNKGFLLIYAVLISGIILTVGVGIIGTTLRTLQLASNGRESVRAFFAADAAVECVLHWDLAYDTEHVGGNPRTSTPFATSTASTAPSPGIYCVTNTNDISTSWQITEQTPTTATTKFDLRFVDGDGVSVNDPFAKVTVSKTNGGGNTEIIAEGFNSPDETYARRVQRTLKVSY